MIFHFLKYIWPIWYFNLRPKIDLGYFPTVKQLEDAEIYFEIDINYKSENSQIRDIAWTAFQQGYINKDKINGLDIWEEEFIPVHDEYVFLRKNFNIAWVFYVLIIRIITFKNPFREIICFFKTRKIKRMDYYQNHIKYNDYDNFDSTLIKQNPLVSVIIPTLNRYEYLKDVFRDLENQTYTNFEVIVVDQTDDFQESFYESWKLDLKFWFQEEKALWKARNEAIKSAKGNYILMSEDDIAFNSSFIENHLKTLDYFKCDVSCGVFFPENSEIPKNRSYFKYAEQFATGNAMLKKELFEKVGLFDRQFEKQRMGDGEFGLRLYSNGFMLISNPYAFCIDIKAPLGGLRQMGSWDSWRPKKLFGPRPVPSVLYCSRKYFGLKLSRYLVFKEILPSLIPYRFRKNKLLMVISFLFLPFVLPLVLFQVSKSWNLASKKLKEGELISDLK